jgi:phosphate transport system substrate-binding protein
VPGLKEFAEEYVSPAALGEDGYLAAKGLVPLPAEEFAQETAKINAMTPMSGADLE